MLDSTHIQTLKIFEAKGTFFTILKEVSRHQYERQWIIAPEGIRLNHRRQRVTTITPPPYSIGLESPVLYEQESTTEGTPYHSNIESYTAPFKTDAESHQVALLHNTISMFITATAHSMLLPHNEASTNTAFVLLIPHYTIRRSQSATHRELHPRTLLLISS